MYDSSSALEKPRFGTQLSDRTITENSTSVKLTCSLLTTDCEISWEKNKIPIRPSSKYRMTMEDGLAILEISDVSDEDAGKYSCIASNKFGDCMTSCKLKVFSGYKPTSNITPIFTRQVKGIYCVPFYVFSAVVPISYFLSVYNLLFSLYYLVNFASYLG